MSLIDLVIYLAVFVVLALAIYYIISQLNLPSPINQFLMILLVVIAAVIVIAILLSFRGGGGPKLGDAAVSSPALAAASITSPLLAGLW